MVNVWVCRDTSGYIGISGICGEIQKYISYRQYFLPNLMHMSSLLAEILTSLILTITPIRTSSGLAVRVQSLGLGAVGMHGFALTA